MHLDLPTCEALLKTKIIGRVSDRWPNEVWSSIDSTNARALTLAAEGAADGVFVAARQQTAGRGRLGRTWVSPPDSGLYVSFILRPQLPVGALPLISLAAGVAVAKTIERCCGINAGLKWVNDIVYDSKKVGGILCEMQAPPALVAGIGINLCPLPPDTPPEIQLNAGSLENITGSPVDPNLLLAALCAELERSYILLVSNQRSAIILEWKRHSITLGQLIKAKIAGQEIIGQALDLSPDGSLIIEKETGERLTLHAGEVTIRKLDGSYA